MNSVAEAWARLGIPATDDKREVKRAYGRALKAIDPDINPQAFLDLREAYDAALQWGTQTPYWEMDDPDDLEEMPEPIEAEGEEAELATLEPAHEDWWERWRPEPPEPVAADGLGEACQQLDRLLFDDPPPQPERILEAGKAVLAHPGLAEVDRLTETELWIAEAISASIPRSDPLIEPAIARFGWKQAEQDWRRHHQVESVLARRDDRIFLERCRKSPYVHCVAVEALTRPPPRKLGLTQLGLAHEVGNFLDVVTAEHPTVERDLDPDSLAWWRDYLHRRHLPPSFWYWMLAAPVSLTSAAAFALDSLSWPLWLLLPTFALAALATWGALLGKAELDARARRREPGEWEGDPTPSAAMDRLVIAALLLPPAVALLPNGTFWAGISLTASLGLVAAGLRRKWVPPGWGLSDRNRLFLPVVAGVVGGTMLAAAASPEQALKLFPPHLAMCWLGSRCHAAMQMRLDAGTSETELKVIAISFVCLLLAGGLVLRLALGGDTPLWVLLLVPSAIVFAHLAAAASPVDVHYLEWPLRIVAVIVYFVTGYLGEDLTWLRLTTATAVYGLLYAGSLLLASIGLLMLRLRGEGNEEEGLP